MTYMRLIPAFLIVLLVPAPSLSARDRDAARKAFTEAREYHQILQAKPIAQRSLRDYNRALFLYRRVIDFDPTYGAADDSIYAIASLYDEMAQRFGSARYRERAVYYYQFLAREYPLTRYRQRALGRVREMAQTQSSTASSTVSRLAESRPSAAPSGAQISSTSPSPRATPAPQAENGQKATVSEIRYWSNEDYTRVVIQLDREVDFRKEVLSDPDRIFFDLQDAHLEPGLEGRAFDIDDLFIRQVRVAQNQPDVVRVVLDFKEIESHNVFALYDPYRIVIDSRGGHSSRPGSEGQSRAAGVRTAQGSFGGETAAANPAIAARLAFPAAADPSDLSLTRVLGLKVGRVVLDPGHGGKDSGTIGAGGLMEKDVVLSVALRLRELLRERLGLEVVMTRETDVFIPLEQRTAIANQHKADLFISIHANASRNRNASGIETYYLNFASSAHEREVATRENAGAQKNIRELEDLLRQIALGDYNQESRQLAHIVQHHLHAETARQRPNTPDRGVKTAPFIVLLGAQMPSILTEIGFLSNSADEKFYRQNESQEFVAEALFKGVEDYFRQLTAGHFQDYTAGR